MKRLIARVGSSLRLRLLVAGFVVASLAALASNIYTSWHALHEVDEILNAALEQNARSLMAVLVDHGQYDDREHIQELINSFSSPDADLTSRNVVRFGSDDDEEDELLEYQRHMYLRVMHAPTSLDVSTKNLPMDVPTDRPEGYFDLTRDHHLWHFFNVQHERTGPQLFLGQRADYRDELIEESSESVIIELLLLLPMMSIALWWAIGSAMRDLRNLSREIAARESSHLQPVVHGHELQETRGVVSELNALFKRVRKALDNERRFTSDASHELRTPIASMRAQLDILNNAPSATQHHDAIERLHVSCTRMSALVEDLLSLSRLDSESMALDSESFDLHALLQDIVADVAVLAIDKNIEMSLQPERVQPVHSVLMLHRLVAINLLSNAIKYTPDGGVIVIHLSETAGRSVYVVEDSGPGVPEDQLDKLTDRFYRLPSVRYTSEGSGLGLSIVQRAAELLNADIQFANRRPHGLRVSVQFKSDDRSDGLA